MVQKEQVTKGDKEPYTLSSSFTMSIMLAYSLLLELTTTLCDRAFVEPSVFQHNHITQTDTQKLQFQITL